MMNKLTKISASVCALLLVLTLSGCEERQSLAPVVELNWKEINKSKRQHIVARGDTLFAIAFRYDQDYRHLAVANHLSSPYTLRVGQVIKLQYDYEPAPVSYSSSNKPPRSINPIRYTPPPVAVQHQQHYAAWLWPVRGRVVANYVPQQGRKGIDIAGRKGEKIQAAAAGTVAYAGNGLAGYGNLIIIKHDNQYLTAYGNNLRNLVKEGQHISQGQAIADIGVVDRRYWGVHFEIRKAGKPVNPLNYLQK